MFIGFRWFRKNPLLCVNEEYVYKSYGEDVIIACPETENVIWKYNEWLTDKEGRTVLKEEQVSNASNIHFQDLSKKEEGIYKCFSNGRYVKYFRLFVDKPQAPYFTKETTIPYRSRFKGSFVLFKCPSVKGYPPPDIVWIHNEKELTQSSKFNLDVKVIPKVDLEDAGTLVCVAKNKAGSVNFTYQLEVFNTFPSKTYKTDPNYNNLTFPAGTSATVKCTTREGQVTELARIVSTKWYYLPKTISNLTEEKIILSNNSLQIIGSDDMVISSLNSSHEGWYACMENGRYEDSPVHITSLHYLRVAGEKSPAKWIGAVLLLISLIFLVTFTLCFYYRKKIKKEKMIALEESRAYWTKKIVIERNPDALPVVTIERHRAHSPELYYQDEGTIFNEFQLPLDSFWEIPRNNLNLGKVLGTGAFGKVVKAKAIDIFKLGQKSTVAVKMLKDGSGDEEMLNLVSEMEIMKIIGKHPNIINLIGCCTQGGPLYVVVEYAPHGNLLDYLKKHHSVLMPKSNRKLILSEKQLLLFALQVAQGMEYLASKKYIHRDLAARNILISEDFVLKIADFGLAKECDNYYRKKSEGLVPVKWMCPQALTLRIYTTKSDVWSFGILLYEIMSLGEVPYPTVNDPDTLLKLLKNGYRMEKPEGCSQEIYTIMQECWNLEPEERPTFTQLVQKLNKVLSKIENLNYATFDYRTDLYCSLKKPEKSTENKINECEENINENVRNVSMVKSNSAKNPKPINENMINVDNPNYYEIGSNTNSILQRKSLPEFAESSLYKILHAKPYARMT